MNKQQELITSTLTQLFEDAKFDKIKMMKGITKSIFRPMQPLDFKDVYLSISKEQGENLIDIIKTNNLKNIVEFGTSFGISTLFLAKGVLETKGHIITTELLESKAKKAIKNFEKAEVTKLIEIRIGDALETLKNHNAPIDMLLLDGWMNLYQPLFQMLKSNFHNNTIIYVDNANMADSKQFLTALSKENKYQIELKFNGKVALINYQNKI